MKHIPLWESPKTSRVYLHAPGARRLVLLQPDFKITSLRNHNLFSFAKQESAGVIVLVGRDDPLPLDFEKTVFDTPKDGFPIYTMRNTEPQNGCEIQMTAFATSDEHPISYQRLTLTNRSLSSVQGSIGLMLRAAASGAQALTALSSSGYCRYAPNPRAWFMQREIGITQVTQAKCKCEGGKGFLQILSTENADVHFVSHEEPRRFSANDYFACDYTLSAGETMTVDFTFSDAQLPRKPLSFEAAERVFYAYWGTLLGGLTAYPNTDAPVYCDLFLQNVTQCLQMLSKYDDSSLLVARQGDVSHYVFLCDAVVLLHALDRLGFHKLTASAYRVFLPWVSFEKETLGQITYPYVAWENAVGALMWGLSEHLLMCDDAKRFKEYYPYLRNMLKYIDSHRISDEDSAYVGLFAASESAESGVHHWVFTDAYFVRAIESMHRAMEHFGIGHLPTVERILRRYRRAVLACRDALYQGHENDDAYLLPHITSLSEEQALAYSFASDGAPYLTRLGFMDIHSEMFEQMERFFIKNDLFDHGLSGKMLAIAEESVGMDGDIFVTGAPDYHWIYAWMERGEDDKVRSAIDALYRYHFSREYIPSERYCPADPWYTPWQPNGSASARLLEFMLDYYK